MIQSFRNSLAYKVFILIAAIIVFIILIFLIFNDPNRAAIGDSVQYWAAARLSLTGENPYSADMVLELRNHAGNTTEFPEESISMMLYPPWTLPLLIPFGLLEYQYFRLIWLLLHICLIFISTWLIWKLYKGPGSLLWLGYLVAFTFEPTILLLGTGHITMLHLIGLIGFLHFIHKSEGDYRFDLIAGTCLASVSIKPQLLIIFLTALLLWTIHQKRYLVFFGGAATLLITSIIAFVINPSAFNQYWISISQYPLGAWATPTIGGVFRLIFGIDNEWLQILPTIFGLVWVIYYWINRKDEWNWKKETPLLVLVSVVGAVYVWTYDMVLLLLPILQVVIISIRRENKLRTIRLLFSYFLVSVGVLITHIYLNDFWFFWFSPFILIWYLVGRKSTIQPQLPFKSFEI